MKTSHDPRHKNRQKAVQALYAWGFQSSTKPENQLAEDVVGGLAKIDELVKLAAPSRPIEQINRIDLSILRLAIFELMEKKETPYKVVVDEAVELAKEFGSDASPGFINGALGKLITSLEIDRQQPQ